MQHPALLSFVERAMFIRPVIRISFIGLLLFAGTARADALKPYVLGDTPPGDLNQVEGKVRQALASRGFEVVGSYAPYPGAVVICVTNQELKAARSQAKNGGFGA